MGTVDDRVVKLNFDNKQFETATATSMSTLDKLKKSLDFSSSRKGADELSNSLGKMHMGSLPVEIEGASAKFLALATIGVTALAQISAKALQTGAVLVKSLTIDPIKMGFEEYQTNLNAVQTILSNTQAAGGNLKTVNAALDELNTYSDQTIYNFSEMAKNIGTFTAAGVDLKHSTAAIKGIANLAALSGSNSQQASTAMYQLSQALAAGKVTLMDWNSVVNAGMGGAVFQRALAQTAEKMGTLTKGAVKLTGPMKNVSVAGMSFRESISDPKVGGWLTSDVLTKTLAQFTGDLTDAELKAQGFSAAEIKTIQAQALAAKNAATEVKTITQAFDVAKETAGSGWAKSWQIIMGDFGTAKKDFTAFSNFLNGIINKSADARNNLLEGWAQLGGRTEAIQAFKNALAAVMSVLDPIKKAFRQIFPPATAKDLYNLTVTIRDFFANIKLGTESADRLRRIFAGVFAILDIVKQVIGGFISVFVDLATSVNEGSGGFMELVARVGDFLVKVDQAIKNGEGLANFFDGLSTILQRVMGFISGVGDSIIAIFDGSAAAISATGDALGRVKDRLSPLGGLATIIFAAWNRFIDLLKILSPAFAEVLQNISDMFSNIGPAISEAVQNGNYSAMLDTINTVIFGAIALLFRKFMKNGIKIDTGGGFLGQLSGIFNTLTGSLKAMETQIKAKALLEIAAAVAILTISVVALSLIDSKKLTIALAGMATIFTELMGAMYVLGKIAGSAGFIKIPLIAASLIMLSTAILLLTGAVKILSGIPFGDLVKGLLALAGILGVVLAALNLMPAESMIRNSAALIGLGVALNILAVAMKIFATMSWEDIAKGLASVAGALAVIGVTMTLMPTGMVLQAAALVGIASALTILAGAVAIFGTLSWESIAKGLVGIGGALLIIAGAMALMPGPMLILTAAGLVLVALALNGIAAAMLIMGSMSWEEIGKGMVTLAGSLIILAGGLYLMTGTLVGSAALLVAAGALAILAPVLKILGGMSWEEIAKGLVALAGAFAVIGLAGLLLSPIIVPILGVAAAVAVLGVGLALIGLGILAFATAITLLVAAGSMGVAALTAILATVIGIIPTVMKALEVALIAFATAIINAAPAVIAAIVVVLVSLMNAIIKLTPKIMQTLGVLLAAFIKLIVSYVPKLVVAGIQMITGILNGIAKNMPKLLEAGANVIIAFIKGIGAQSLRIIKAAGDTLINFLNGLTKWIRDNTRRLNNAGVDLIEAIIDGMISGIGSLGGMVIRKFQNLGSSIIDGVKGIFGIDSPAKEFISISKYNMLGLAKGMDDNTNVVDLASRRAGKAAIDAMKESMSGLSDVMNADIDIQPTIAPVLDLTQFRKDAVGINDILTPKDITATTSASNATSIQAAADARVQAASQELAATGTNVFLEQNNYSPKALSSADIYRQTKNQLSVVKGVLEG